MTTKTKSAPPTLVTDVGRFAIVPTWLLMSGVSDRAVRLYALLAGKYASYDTKEAFPSRRTLATDINCSLSTLDRTIDELAGVSALTVERRQASNGDYISNIYKIRIVIPDDGPNEVAVIPLVDQVSEGVASPVTIGGGSVTGDASTSHGWIEHSSPVTTQGTRSIERDLELTKEYSAEERGASRSPVENSSPDWNTGLAIAHRVREDYPKNPENWLPEIKARMLNQGIDANHCGPDGTKGKFFHRVWEQMLVQANSRRGDGGVTAWRYRHAARQGAKQDRRISANTS